MVRGVNYLFLGLALSILCFSFISASEFGVEIGKDRASTTTISTITFTGNLTNFTTLQDTPNSYVGNGLDCLRVNAGETAVEFFACAGGGDFSFSDFAGAFNSNITKIEYGNFNFSNFQTSFNLNSSYLFNKSSFSSLFNSTLSGHLPLENKTIIHCSNITGNATDLCSITSSGSGGDFYWANFSGSFNSNISQIAYGNFNFSNFQTSFNLNSSYLFNTSLFQTGFNSNSTYLLNKSEFAGSFVTNISNWEAKVNASYLATSNLWATNGTSIYNATVSQVGIGTATPTNKLEVWNGSIMIDDGGAQGIIFKRASVEIGRICTSNSQLSLMPATGKDTIVQNSAGTQRFIIKSATGYIGIGATTPAYLLEITNASKALNVSGKLYVNTTDLVIGSDVTSPQGGGGLHFNNPTGVGQLVITGASENATWAGIALGNISSVNNITKGSWNLVYKNKSGGAEAEDFQIARWNNGALTKPFIIEGTASCPGCIGIGTDSPTHILNVVGNSNFSQNVTISGSKIYSNGTCAIYTNLTGSPALALC